MAITKIVSSQILNEISRRQNDSSSNGDYYRLVLDCIVDGEKKYYEFDTVDKISISESSTVTTHPLLNGDVVADHMYKEPNTISISGTFSMVGLKKNTYTKGSDRLKSIQEIFENLKNDGVLCNLTFKSGSTSVNVSTRFIIRKNYVINNIEWDQGQASMGFDIKFTEVLFYDAPTMVIEEEDDPSISEASKTSMNSITLNSSEILNTCKDELKSNNILTEDFIESYSNNKSLILSNLSKNIASKSKNDLVTLTTNQGDYKKSILNIFNTGIKLYLDTKIPNDQLDIENFVVYDTEDQKKNENQRFINWQNSIIDFVEDIINPNITSYSISNADLIDNTKDVEIDCIIDSHYYTIKLTQNNDTKYYNVDIFDNDENSVCLRKGQLDKVGNIFDLKDSDSLFNSSNNYAVYILNNKYADIIYNSYLTTDEKEQQLLEASEDLSNYIILIVKGGIENIQHKFDSYFEHYLYKSGL